MTAATDTTTWPAPAARIELHGLTAGTSGQVVVTLDIPAGCHIQSHEPKEPFLIPTTVEVDPVEGIEISPAVYPSGHTDRFDWTPVELDVYRDVVEIVVPIELGIETDGDEPTVSGRVRYQGCTATACLPPVERTFEARLE